MFALHPRIVANLFANLTAKSFESSERLGTQEAVTPDPFPANDALKKESTIGVAEFVEGSNGSQGIAKELPVNGHNRVVQSEFGKGIVAGVVTHRLLVGFRPTIDLSHR
jgi:hypothetical protein